MSFSISNICHAKNHSILLLGDSLSAAYGMPVNNGWVALLNKRFKQQKSSIEIINASISGETTAGGLARLPSILANNDVDYLIIELGANDGLRGFNPKKISNNLLQIIELAKFKDIPVALFDIKIPPNYGPRYNKLFNDVFTQVAKEKNITLLPFFMEQIAVKPKLMKGDGLHPNEAGQKEIVEIVEAQFIALVTAK